MRVAYDLDCKRRWRLHLVGKRLTLKSIPLSCVKDSPQVRQVRQVRQLLAHVRPSPGGRPCKRNSEGATTRKRLPFVSIQLVM